MGYLSLEIEIAHSKLGVGESKRVYLYGFWDYNPKYCPDLKTNLLPAVLKIPQFHCIHENFVRYHINTYKYNNCPSLFVLEAYIH